MEACGEEWKEWTSLKELTDQIPQQYQFGLSVAPLNLMCLDAYHDHLVIGTNAGLVYLGHLPSFNLIRLKCENVTSPIQSVAAVSSVDDMIAAGCYAGIITVFQIPPASSSDELTASHGGYGPNNPTLQPSCLQRFTVHIHKAPVTALVWSRNGMRLFSGDKEGNICLIEVDYDRQQCTGKSLFKVDTRVVQLSYTHQMLAISYEERCLIYNLRDDSKTVVGKKPRIPPGLFGCAFAPSLESPKEDILYCARPGQRIWSANTTGEVLFSYIQKKSLQGSTMQLLNIHKPSQPKAKFSFGFLYHYKGSILVSYLRNYIIILNVSSQKIIGYCEDFAKICDVAVTGDFIFVLDSNRNIICLSPYKPSFGTDRPLPSVRSSFNLLAHENLTPSALSEIRSKMTLPNKHLIDGIAKFSGTVASKLSEIATPAIIPGNKHSPSEGAINSEDAHASEYQEHIHRPKPYFFGFSGRTAFQPNTHNKISERSPSPEVCEAGQLTPLMDENAQKGASPTIDLGRQYDVVVLPSRSRTRTKKKIEILSDAKREAEAKVREFNDDSRPYEVFKEAIEEKESLLADVLNLSALRMDHEKMNDKATAMVVEHEGNESAYPEMNHPRYEPKKLVSFCEPSTSEMNGPEQPPSSEFAFGLPPQSSVANSSMKDSAPPSMKDSVPPIHFNNTGSVFKEGVAIAAHPIEGITLQEVNTMPPPEEFPWGWQKHHLPSKPQGFLGYDNTLLFSELRDLYFSTDFFPENENLPSWRRKRLMVEIASFCCFDKELLLLTRQGHLLTLDRDKLILPEPLCGHPVAMEDSDIVSAASDKNVIWILTQDGKVAARLMSERQETEIQISCQELRFRSLVCRSGVVWGITTSGRIAYRIGVRQTVPQGIEWGIMLHPHKVMCIHLSENGLGWMMDSEGGLYVSLYVSQSYPQGFDGKWWQIGISDYMLDQKASQQSSGASEEAPQIQMTSNRHYFWVSQTDSPFAFSHSLNSFVGHRWEALGPSQFQAITGGGIFKSFGTLYCMNKTGDLFAVNPHEDCVLPMELPSREKLVSVSARPESLWVLTKSGKIYIRTGLFGSSCFGHKWVRLDMQQIADVRLQHISLSTEVVWAVDTKGQVYMRQGPVTPPNPKKKGLDPAWLHVDSNELKDGAVFKEVHVGNKSHLVWGLDTNGRIYVREAIFPELSTGTSWVLVSGIYAQSLSISEDKVYVVTKTLRLPGDDKDSSSVNDFTGQLFEREGVSPTNYIGDSWKRIPTNSVALKAITVSVDNCLWGLNTEGAILKHSSLSLFDVSLREELPTGMEGGFTSSDLDLDLEDWEII